MKSKTTNWLIKHTLTVFSCVLIIVLGIVAISYADPVTTSIGENISTNDLTVAGDTNLAGLGVIGLTTLGANLDMSDNNIINVGDIAFNSISSDAGTSVNVVLGSEAGDDFTVDTDKLVVEGATGNVGIGTTAPGSQLDVRVISSDMGATGRGLFVYEDQGVTVGMALAQVKADNIGTAIPVFDIWNDGIGDSFTITDGGSVKFRVADGGDVFINEKVSGNLPVYGSIYALEKEFVRPSGVKGIFLKYNTIGDRGIIWSYDYVGNTYEELNMDAEKITFEIEDVEKMRIDNAGNVGIGDTTPATKLEVDGIIKTTPTTSRTCNADSEGGIMYDSDDNHFYGCNGTAWVQLDN